MPKIAIIGSGPGGLVAAKYLKNEGFDVVLFELGESLGGQWASNRRYSGVWPAMHTNTSRIMTAFSDLEHTGPEPVYPHNQTIHAYLHRYAEKFGINTHIRLKTRVREISRNPSGEGWLIGFTGADGTLHQESYSRVIVATGRCLRPRMPLELGLNRFQGKVSHAFQYAGAEPYAGQKVLVIGCSISALEIASELALSGVKVFSTHRRQRYILQKFVAGVPVDQVVFNRFSALVLESLSIRQAMDELKEVILSSSGSPEYFGAGKPSANILEAGITQCQHFLPLVAEGKIESRAWLSGVEGQTVQFSDGNKEKIDAIICGTGYDLDLPFLNRDIQMRLRMDGEHIDLYKCTFHPDLPGLAFLGLFELFGPYFPVLELQARWIAYLWSGALPAVSSEQMSKEISGNATLPMHTAALLFARAAGVEPEIAQWPDLARILLFGPMLPMSFRLNGRDSLPDAAQRVADETKIFETIGGAGFTAKQYAQLQSLAAARQDKQLTQLLANIQQPV